MFSNMAVSLFERERIETTLPKAKEVRGVAERLITYAKQGDLHARRLAAERVNDSEVLKKLFTVIGPHFKDRNGGYVRVLKTGERKGDNTLMAIVELVGLGGAETVRKRKKKKKTEEPGAPGAAKPEEKKEQPKEKAAAGKKEKHKEKASAAAEAPKSK
jgi:large subunit ribosomal protein L17